MIVRLEEIIFKSKITFGNGFTIQKQIKKKLKEQKISFSLIWYKIRTLVSQFRNDGSLRNQKTGHRLFENTFNLIPGTLHHHY